MVTTQDYSFSPITLFHTYAANDERRNPVDFGSQVELSSSPPPPEMGCDALHCLVVYYILPLNSVTVSICKEIYYNFEL